MKFERKENIMVECFIGTELEETNNE